MIIYSAGVVDFEVDLIVLLGFCAQTYPSLLKWSSHVLTIAHVYLATNLRDSPSQSSFGSPATPGSERIFVRAQVLL